MGQIRSERYIPIFPNEVWLENEVLRDNTLREEYPVNGPAAMLLSLVDGRRSVAEIVNIISLETGATEQEVMTGAQIVLWKLNSSYLINFNNHQIHDEVREVANTLLKAVGWTAGVPQVNCRISLTGHLWIDLGLSLQMSWLTFRTPGLVIALLFGGPAVFLGHGFVLLGFLCAFILAVFVHELGHILALRVNGYGVRDMGLVVTPGSVCVIRRPAGDEVEAAVGMAGPTFSAAVGSVLLGGYWLMGWQWTVIGALPFLLQLMSLAPVFDDNKVLRRALLVSAQKISNKNVGGFKMSNVLRWIGRFVMTFLAIYMLFITVSLAVSIVADVTGTSSFRIGAENFALYSFTKEPQGFHGALGGAAFWLTVTLTSVSVWLARRHGTSSSHH